MKNKYLNKSLELDNIILPNSNRINPYLLRNNYADILKAIDFLSSDEKFLYIHGFMGTGKRQFINYIIEFINTDVVHLEYYCKESTVCDDILLAFTQKIENLFPAKALNVNAKITTLNVKLKQQISSIKKPFLIVINSFDDVLTENADLIRDFFEDLMNEDNIKLILSTRAMFTSVLGKVPVDKKIFLKALTKDLFKEFIVSNHLTVTENIVNDFYKYTRGYYYYLALSIKIIQAMKIDLNSFLQKFNCSGMNFDSFLSATYINVLPTAIRNFFWFLRTIRHGISFNALAELELYDEFSIEYLKTNLMIFVADDTVYVQDYFLQKVDFSIPEKTQTKLHKYIIGIYDEQLKVPLKERVLMISRQAMRAEIEYHNQCIKKIQKNVEKDQNPVEEVTGTQSAPEESICSAQQGTIAGKFFIAKTFIKEKKYTEAIETFNQILENEKLDLPSVIDARLQLARLYKLIEDNEKAAYYYNLVEIYYKQNKEVINLNYLYYDLADLYYKMYKHNRAIETIKKVIYSVDTPQSLMVQSCTLLGNIYSNISNYNEAYSYYSKALESLDENIDKETLAELNFKFALVNDDRRDFSLAFEYYNKCIFMECDNPYKALAYSNLASCYLESDNISDALACFKKAYDIEKTKNNYEGIYYNASHIAKIYLAQNPENAIDYLLDAKKSAEFLNEDFYILDATINLGDYYYNNYQNLKEALSEYLSAKEIAERLAQTADLKKIEQRILDMKLRMEEQDFYDLEQKYAK